MKVHIMKKVINFQTSHQLLNTFTKVTNNTLPFTSNIISQSNLTITNLETNNTFNITISNNIIITNNNTNQQFTFNNTKYECSFFEILNVIDPTIFDF